MESITIDMSKSDYSDAAVCDEQNLIHQVQFRQIKNIIRKLIPKDYNFEPEDIKTTHNAISIFGSRGAGKTTFLLTVRDYIQKNYQKQAVIIKTIDPSLIECKQHPFINVIAAIHETVEDYDNYHYRKQSDYRSKLELYNNAFQQVLKGLPFIDGVGNDNIYKDWDDELFVSMQGMEKAEASNNLERDFHDYINKALKLMNKQFFVVSFDDIDTNFNKGYEILEVVRKYLTSEQIITILTGDMELYGKLVRKASWKCFDSEFLKKETEYTGKDKSEFANIINQLENQYLLKILKPENRVHLLSLQELTSEYSQKIIIKYDDNKKEPLDLSYRKLLSIIFSLPYNTLKEYINFLKGLSLRAQLRILHLVKRIYSDEEFSENNERIIQSFVSIFCNDINQKAANAKGLLGYSKYYPVEIQKFLSQANILHQCTDLVPQTKDDTLNKALLAISAQYGIQAEKNKYMLFDYWIRVCYLDYITQSFGFNEDNKLREFIKYTFIGDYNNLTNCVGRCEAFYQGYFGKGNSLANTMPGTIAIKNLPENYNPHDLSSLIVFSTLNNDKQESYFASIYKLVAIIRDLLFCNLDEQKQIVTFLRKHTEFKSYLEPNPNKDLTYKNLGRPSSYEVPLNKDYDLFKYNIISDLYIWIKNNQNKKYRVNSKSLKRIFSRTFFSIININKTKTFTNLGDKFNSYLLVFLNAVLEEELVQKEIEKEMYSMVGNRYYFNNAINYIDEFKHNIRILGSKYEHTLFYWLLNCPLIYCWMNPLLRISIQNLLDEKDKYEENEHLWDAYIFDEMSRELNSLKEKESSYSKIIEQLGLGSTWLDDVIQSKQGGLKKEPLVISLEPFEHTKIVLHPLVEKNLIMEKNQQISRLLEKYYILKDEVRSEIKHFKIPLPSNLEKIRSPKQIDSYKQHSPFEHLCSINIY